MARYGESAEDFNAESQALERAMQARKRVAAAEGEMTTGLNRSSSALDRATQKTKLYTQAQKEAQEFDKRDEATARSKASARDVDTAAIERNTAAQRANAAAARTGGAGPGSALIRHPELYGRQGYAPVSQPVGNLGRGLPGTPVQEYPLSYGGGHPGYDSLHEQNAAKAAQGEVALNRAMQDRNRIAQVVAQNEAHLNDLYGASATRQASLAEATRRTGAEWGAASQQMTRHGALSSEFIQAAVKGQTGIREIGNQALVTAGKFGAWTLAATAVYGVVRGIGTLGQGAIAGQSGAQQLRRVINNVDNRRAGEQFNQLSGQFNVPIEQSADAVYRMGQVFHDQTDAVNAAKAALYSYQTGEVDVATSTRNLIAIQRGFGFSSTDLLKIYDQINQAQNTFGISIGDTEAGLAKAGGTFRNAGGDLNYLLGLFVAISKATGRSGTEIGTGIARAANQIRKPASQAALRGLGVNVDPNNLQSTIQSAISTARKPGADYNAIAAGVFGNQYARLLAPVLRDPSGLQAALGKTSPEASKDSAAKELAKRREQIDYQLKEIGVNMQRIGEALGRSGAFDAIGGLVKGLNGVLKLTLDVVNAFDKLPAPIREAAVLMGELYVAMRLLRRFGVTDRIGAGLGFEGAQNRQISRGVGMGLESGQQAARNEYERLSRQSVAAVSTANIRQDAAVATRRSMEADLAANKYAAGSEQHLAAQQASIRAEQQAALAEARSAELENEVASAKEQVLLYERDIANIKKIEAEAGARGVAAYAEQNALYTRDAKGNVGRGGVVGGVGGAEAAKIAEEDAARQAAAIEAAGARALGPVEQRVAPVSGALRNVGATSNTVLGRLNPLSGAARVTAGALDAGASGLQKVGGVLKGVGSGLGRLALALGPLDYALLGFIAFTTINEIGSKLIEDQNKALDAIERTPTTAEQARAVQKRAYNVGAKRDTGSGVGGYLGHLGQDLNYGFAGAHDVFTGNIFDSNYENASDRDARLKAEAAQAQDEYNNILGLQNAARRKGPNHAIPLQFYGQITKEMAQEQQQRLAGVISEREFDKLLAKNATEIKTGRGDQGSRNRALAELSDMKRRNAAQTHFGQRYDALAPKDLQKELEASAELAQSGEQVGLHLREMAYIYEKIREKLGNQHDSASLQALLKARDALYKGIEDQYNQQLQESLQTATTEPQRQAAYAAAFRATDRLTAIPRAQLTKDQDARAKARDRLAKDQAQLQGAQLLTAPLLGPSIPGVTDVTQQQARDDVKKLQDRIKADNAAIDGLDAATKRDRKDIKAAQEQRKRDRLALRDSSYQDRESGRSIDLAYRQSATRDPNKQAADAVRSAQKQVADATRTYGIGSRQWKQAMTALNQAKHSQSQTIVDSTNADNALMQANVALTGDSVAVARAAETAAQNTLNALRASGADTNKIKEATANVKQAHLATLQALAQQDSQMVAAQGAMLTANATADPTGGATARATVTNAQNALAQVARDPTLHGKDRAAALLNARATLRSANIALANFYRDQANQIAQARFDLKESTVDDPVRRAQIELQKARDAIGRAQTPQDKIQARAAYNNARRTLRDTRLQSREDDIDFDLDMDKITRDQAINQYQALLKSHNLTKAQRQEIMRKIKQLRDDSANAAQGFDLDVGSIKLPTIYDVRRAIGTLKSGLSQGSRAQVNSNVQVNVEVTDPKAAPKVFDAIDRALGTGIGAGMQQAGLTL